MSVDGVPLYRQIKADLLEQIKSGQLAPGERIESELELMARYGVSRATVRQALGQLVAEGYLEIRRGLGTYVATPKLEQGLGGFYSFSREIERLGMRPGTRVLGVRLEPATRTVAAALGLPLETPVVALRRLRLPAAPGGGGSRSCPRPRRRRCWASTAATRRWWSSARPSTPRCSRSSSAAASCAATACVTSSTWARRRHDRRRSSQRHLARGGDERGGGGGSPGGKRGRARAGRGGAPPGGVGVAAQRRAAGAVTIAVTCRAESPLASLATERLVSPLGDERAIVMTRSFTSMLALPLGIVGRGAGGP